MQNENVYCSTKVSQNYTHVHPCAIDPIKWPEFFKEKQTQTLSTLFLYLFLLFCHVPLCLDVTTSDRLSLIKHVWLICPLLCRVLFADAVKATAVVMSQTRR